MPLESDAGDSTDGQADVSLREMLPVDDNPMQLMGQSGLEVADLLGPPGMIRRDGTAEVWQYRATDCILDVFLYARDDTLRVHHVELRGPGVPAETRRACFAGMVMEQRALSS